MSADTSPTVMVEASNPADGCTGCGSRATVQLHPYRGRRCPDCMTVPPGPFRADFAADLVEMGRPDAAFAYLAAFLAHETGRRFDAAVRRLQPLTVGRLTSGVLTADVILAGALS